MSLRCPHCGTTPLSRVAARIAWWLHLGITENLSHEYGCRARNRKATT